MNYEEMTDAILNEGIFNRFISNNTSAKNQRDAIIRQSNQNKSNIEKKYENIKPKEKEYKKPEIEFKPYILKVPQKKTPTISRKEAVKKAAQILKDILKRPNFKEFSSAVKIEYDGKYSFYDEYIEYDNDESEKPENCCLSIAGVSAYGITDDPRDQSENNKFWNFVNDLVTESNKKLTNFGYILDVEGDRDGAGISIYTIPDFITYYNSEECYNKEYIKLESTYEELTDSLLEGFFSKTKTEYKLEDGIPSIEVVFNKVKQISNKLLNGKYKSIKKYIKLVNSINTDNKLWKWKSVHIGVANIETMDEDEYNSNIDDINGYIQSLNDELESMYGTHECKNYSKAVPYYSIDMAGDDGEIFLDTTAYVKVKVDKKTGEEIKR